MLMLTKPLPTREINTQPSSVREHLITLGIKIHINKTNEFSERPLIIMVAEIGETHIPQRWKNITRGSSFKHLLLASNLMKLFKISPSK